jgi:ABC-2 type transport system permease protein
MKSYLTYFKLRLITNLQYRAAALAGMSTQFFFGFVFIMVYLAFYESNGTVVAPMKWNELVTYMWLQQALFALIYPLNIDSELMKMIINGNVAYEIIRPQSFYLKFYIKALADKIISTLLKFWPIIIICSLLPYPFHLSGPESFQSFLLFLAAIILGFLLVTALAVLIHILTMFTIDSKGFIGLYSVIAEVFSGATIPIPFFPVWMQKIAYVLPFRYFADFPFRLYTGSIGIEEGLILLVQSFAWIIVILLIGVIVSHLALRKAVIQGG